MSEYKCQNIIVYNQDFSKGCLVEVTVKLHVETSADPMECDKLVVEDKWWAVNPNYHKSNSEYYGDWDSRRIAYKASEAARLVNMYIGEANKYDYKYFKELVDDQIKRAEYKIKQDCRARRLMLFRMELDNLLTKYGATINADEVSGYEDDYTIYDIGFNHDGDNYKKDFDEIVSTLKNYKEIN